MGQQVEDDDIGSGHNVTGGESLREQDSSIGQCP